MQAATPPQELRFPPKPPGQNLARLVADALPATDQARLVMRRIDLLVIHCSATPNGRSLSGNGVGPTAAQVIDGWHADRLFTRRPGARAAYQPQLAAIGYHFVIDVDGTVQPGRALAEVGAHARGFNANSIGVCLVGGRETVGRYTEAQWDALRQLLLQIEAALSTAPFVRIPRTAAIARNPAGVATAATGVVGHRDLSVDLDHDRAVEPSEWLKTCPGFDVATWLQRGMVPLPENVFLPTAQPTKKA